MFTDNKRVNIWPSSFGFVFTWLCHVTAKAPFRLDSSYLSYKPLDTNTKVQCFRWHQLNNVKTFPFDHFRFLATVDKLMSDHWHTLWSAFFDTIIPWQWFWLKVKSCLINHLKPFAIFKMCNFIHFYLNSQK